MTDPDPWLERIERELAERRRYREALSLLSKEHRPPDAVPGVNWYKAIAREALK